MNNELVIMKGRNATTTSLIVAEKFHKRHERVLTSVQNLDCSEPFAKHNFVFCSYDDRGRKMPMVEMTRDGFTFLVMGFTGKKAAKFKEDFINAFNAMERIILQQQNLSWKQLRLDGKNVRHELTDEIKAFVDYATSQGSKSAGMYFMNITKMTNQALFLIGRKAPQGFRDMLNNMQLSFVQTAEFVARNALRSGMVSGLHYKEIYKLAREKVSAFSATVGKTPVPAMIDGCRTTVRKELEYA
jgi:Rha family phage regulatory protein